MKKFFVMGLGLSVAFAMTSCKSSESAYKKAYEKAKQQQVVAAEQDRLLFANSFPAADLATAEYFIFSVTKEVLFNPEHTVLNIYGNVEENVKTGLGKYFTSVKIIS